MTIGADKQVRFDQAFDSMAGIWSRYAAVPGQNRPRSNPALRDETGLVVASA